jgi:hypothetical protein
VRVNLISGLAVQLLVSRSGFISGDHERRVHLMAGPLNLFYSYAHEDERYLKELIKHLALLKRQGYLSDWSDREITAGSLWAGIIDDRIKTAHIVLFLISADFFASDYCFNTEMTCAFDRHAAGESLAIIPVILRPYAGWQTTALGQFQALPPKGKAVQLSRSKDLAYSWISDGIKAAAMSLGATGLPPDMGSRGSASRTT